MCDRGSVAAMPSQDLICAHAMQALLHWLLPDALLVHTHTLMMDGSHIVSCTAIDVVRAL